MGSLTATETISPTATKAINPLRRSDLVIALLLGLLSIVYLSPRTDMLRIDADEGILLQGAARILKGELPYRDFFSFYTPASYYWNALLMRVFGDSVLVPHTALLGYGAVFSALTYLLARRLGSRRSAVFATLLMLMICVPVRYLMSHNWDSTMAALLALCCAFYFINRPSFLLAVPIGLLTGLTILFNQARGVGLLFGLGLGFLLLKFRLGESQLKLNHFAAIAGGLSIPLITTALYFAANGSFSKMVDGLAWSYLHYSGVNRLPYGFMTMTIEDTDALFFNPSLSQSLLHYFIISPIFIICALPIIVILVGLSCAIFRRKDLPREHASMAVLTGTVVLGSVLSISVRSDFHHITFLSPLFFFLLPWLLETWLAPYRSLCDLKPLVIVYVLLSFTAYGAMLMWRDKRVDFRVATRRGNVRTYQSNQTIPYIQAHFPAGSKLLIHPYMSLYYFVTKTMPISRYEYLMPGFHTHEQFQEVKNQLATQRPEAVLFESNFVSVIPSSWPSTPLAEMIYDPVTDYIAQNYKACKLLDMEVDSPANFIVMVRKDLSCEKWRD